MLKKLITKTINNNSDGLAIFGLATGYGKTTIIKEVIAENLKQKKPRRIYFIANQHTLIKDVFDSICSDDNILYFKKRADLITSLFNKYDKQDLYSLIKLKMHRIQFENADLAKRVNTTILQLENNILQEAIPYLKNAIQKYFATTKKPPRKEFAKHYKKWLLESDEASILREIFIELKLDTSDVVLMTTKRMMTPFSYLYKGSKAGWEHIARDKNAIVFFDESDTVAGEILKSVIGNMASLDIINTQKRLKSNIYSISKRIVDNATQKDVIKYIDNFQQYFKKEIDDKFGVGNSFYLNNGGEDQKITLFKYANSDYITSKDYYFDKFDEDNQNYIYLEKKDKYDYKTAEFINKTLTFIDGLFLPTAYNFARFNYINDSAIINNDSAKGDLTSFLDEFLNTENSDLKRYAYNNYTNIACFKPKNRTKELSYGFYKNGLDITTCSVVNSLGMIDIVTKRSYLTKERILENIATNNLVFCVSATAEVKNPLVNFDLEYLKKSLSNKFIDISLRDRDTLVQEYNSRVKNKAKIHTKLILEKDCDNSLSDNLDSRYREEHILSRYKRLATLVKELAETDITVMLAFFNKGISLHNDEFNISELETYIKYYSYKKEHILKLDAQKFKEFDSQQDAIEERLRLLAEKNLPKKLFIITTYESASKGVNLKYDQSILDNSKPKKDIDIDAIYLDNISHLIENTIEKYGKPDYDESLMMSLYQLTYLYENDEISYKKYCRKVVALQGNKPFNNKDLRELELVINKAGAILMQAVGRICRCANKRDNIRVFYSEKVREILRGFELGSYPVTREFKALHEAINKNQNLHNNDDGAQMINHFTRVSKTSCGLINKMLSDIEYKKPKAIANWEILRRKSLQRPSLDTFVDDDITSEMYIDSQKITDEYKLKNTNIYRYSQEDNYNNVEIVKKGGLEVSTKGVGLDRLMTIKPLKELFVAKGYATEINSQARFILSPIVFNNIYKGALGEVAVEYYLTKILGCKIESLDASVYEKMDFKIVGEDIYIDAKLQKFSDNIDYKDMTADLEKKAQSLNADKLIVINVLKTYKQKEQIPVARETLSNNTKVIIISWLFDENNTLCSNTLERLSKEIK